MIETYESCDYGNTPALTEKMIHINDEIAKHKAKSNSIWFGLWNSEEIGNLEPLTFNSKKHVDR